MKGQPGQPINSENPLPIYPWSGRKDDDLTGEVFPCLIVQGWAGGKSTADGSAWVVRCACGRYEIRRSKKLKRQKPGRAYLCSVCEAERNRLQHEEYLRSLVA